MCKHEERHIDSAIIEADHRDSCQVNVTADYRDFSLEESATPMEKKPRDEIRKRKGQPVRATTP